MKILNGESITLGTCYYPEHWKEELWEEDLTRMLENGIQTVRIAEFAWNKIEPREGEFDYSFFDRFLDLTDRMGMQVIFGTPTATPPAWLTTKYPEVLNARQDGVLYRHGARRHYNYNSPVYQELSRRIVEKAASHYAGRRSVIGWQIDNELNCELSEFYSESDTLAFREFLKKKYGTLDRLNEAWGTVFWNQTYTAWEEVYVPRTTCSDSTNPHEVLDYLRFISDSCCRFAKMQSDILRRYIKPGDFITTNGLFGNLDNHRLREESLDFMTYDSYPNFAYCLDAYREEDPVKDRKWSRNLAETRAVSPVFGIMEQQSGANGWNTRMEAPTPEPGQLTLWTMQSIAHGADYVSYFRWRTATMGTEIYWHGILDYSGRDNRRLAEVHSVYEKLQKIRPVAGARYEARVGILKDYDNIFDSQLDVWHSRVEKASQKALFEACQLTHTPFDYCYLDHVKESEELAGYQVLFYPHATIMTEEKKALLEEYVRNGGTLVVGCRSGYKDERGQCVMDKLPGMLKEVTGTDIPEYTMISPAECGKVTVDWDGTTVEAAVFSDLLAPEEGAETVGVYTSNYYAGTPALIRHSYGKGQAYYFGGAFTEKTAEVFLEKLGVIDPYGEILQAPEGCEIAVREKDGARYLFVLNYGKASVQITLKRPVRDLLADCEAEGVQTLQGYETKVYEI
ncbi:MAG TPA: beta-galactosidase [Candidatus Fusicatenibacter merdavium]|uniref:Beta-galactosidase n=1 Tax=Candidatus Fusicatenibacter merdavium TaxID=2838600 RepID=A0A9D1XC41_9FIRM|nr:beta-galactosidase [Candidatus Fusicatenibacter merdavium]